jgi:hypothetical protein
MLFVTCPHCAQLIEIESINCAIFRCAVMKQTGQQVNPHAPKMECDRLAEQGLIYGCGKPFRLESDPNSEGGYRAVICDYI